MMFGRNKGATLVFKRLPVDSVGVEIGVWRGDTSELFLRKARHLHLVDPWSCVPYKAATGGFQAFLQRYAPMVGSPSEGQFQEFYNGVAEGVRKRFDGKPVTIHRMSSGDFFKTFRGPVDWVYIDGSHEYVDVLADLQGARRVVKHSGVICGDDYGAKPGVKPAVDEFAAKYGLTVEPLGHAQFWIVVT